MYNLQGSKKAVNILKLRRCQFDTRIKLYIIDVMTDQL